MLTRKGQNILSDWYSNFRSDYIDKHPGCNDNEIERAFLCLVSVGLFNGVSTEDRERIEAIS